MGYVQTHIIDKDIAICPYCGRYLWLFKQDVEKFNKCEKVEIECYGCKTVFTLLKK